MTTGVDALHMQGDAALVLMMDWSHKRSLHNEAWTLSRHSRAIG